MDAAETAQESYVASKALTKQIQCANNGHSLADEDRRPPTTTTTTTARADAARGNNCLSKLKNATENVSAWMP